MKALQSRRFRNLDDIPDDEVKRRSRSLERRFKRKVSYILLLDFVLFLLVVAYIAFWLSTGLVWTFLLKYAIILKLLLLASTLSSKIEVVRIYGTGGFFRIVPHFFQYHSLGFWALLSFFDFFVIAMIAPLITFIVFLSHGLLLSLQFLSYLVLDFLFIAEFWISVWVVYYCGVRANVRHGLLKLRETPV